MSAEDLVQSKSIQTVLVFHIPSQNIWKSSQLSPCPLLPLTHQYL